MSVLMVGLLLLGIGLRLAQVFGNPSLWADEIRLALNVTRRSLGELLLGGLDYSQVAPVGYLILAKGAVLLFGEGETALRVVSLASSVLALVLFSRLSRQVLDGGGALVATAGFALNPLLISLGSVVKQYSTDVLATILILMAFRELATGRNSLQTRLVLATCAGAVGFLSTPSVMVAIAALAALTWATWSPGELETSEARMRDLTPVVAWAAVAGAAALTARASVSPEVLAYMVDFWRERGAFAEPLLEYPTWALDRGRILLDGLFFSPYMGQADPIGGGVTPVVGPLMFLASVPLAIAALHRIAGARWAVVTAIPLVLALALSAEEVYPLAPRTAAFVLPLLLLAYGASVTLLARYSGARMRRAIPALGVILFAAVLVDDPPLYVVQRDREIVEELVRRRDDGEPVFVQAWSRPTIEYYGARLGVGAPLIFGTGSLIADLRALYRHEGTASLWVLFTSASNRRAYLCYLEHIGEERQHVELSGAFPEDPVSLHHYRLHEPERRASPSALGFGSSGGERDEPTSSLPCEPHR